MQYLYGFCPAAGNFITIMGKNYGISFTVSSRIAQCCYQFLQGCHSFWWLQAAFPQEQHPPAPCTKLFCGFYIVRLIAADFIQPPLRTGFGHYKVAAACVTMPETPLYKNHRLVFRQYDIRLTRQFAAMQCKPKTSPVKMRTYQQFRFGVCAPNAAHIIAPRCPIVYVCHGPKLPGNKQGTKKKGQLLRSMALGLGVLKLYEKNLSIEQ